MAKLVNQTQNQILSTDVSKANTLFERLKGLLGTSELDQNRTLWIPSCNSIHTFFMKYAIDVIFVDRKLVVQGVYRNVKPGKIVWPVLGANSVFEFSSNRTSPLKVNVGDQLHVAD